MLIIKEKWDNPSVNWMEGDMQMAVTTALHRIEKYIDSEQKPSSGLYNAISAFTFAADDDAGKRSIAAGVRAKAKGKRKGEPDYRVYLENGKTWLIEFKRLKKGRVDDEQVKRHRKLERLGHDVVLIFASTPLEAVMLVLQGLAKRLNCEKDLLVAIADLDGYRGNL